MHPTSNANDELLISKGKEILRDFMSQETLDNLNLLSHMRSKQVRIRPQIKSLKLSYSFQGMHCI